ncbi:MAG: hypothetical protein FWB78_02230 [Treponema sp.]|nr:hypothetical protein [Treponema sp.]
MLVGQDIGFAEVVWISIFGMVVATVAIVLLMFFVIIISKIISKSNKIARKKKNVFEKMTSVQGPPISATEDEVASITAALCAERPDQFRIISITRK